MNVRKRWLTLAALTLAALLGLCGQALGETARVVTKGGVLNLRQTPEENAKLVEQIPNASMVDVEEVGEVFSKVIYKKKTGYVKTAYLRLPSQLVGQSVYGDNGMLLLRREADAASDAVYAVGAGAAVQVLALEEDWAYVARGGWTGYVPLSELTYQYAQPTAPSAWIDEIGVVVTPCDLTATKNEASEVLSELEAGQTVTVTMVDKNRCLVVTKDACGYADTSAIRLLGPGDTADRLDGLTPLEASNLASDALSKKFKNFSKEKLYCLTAVCEENSGFQGPLYYCGYYNALDQYLYGALVDAATGKALFTAHYDGFAALPKASDLLPEGEMTLELSADSLLVGEVLDIRVSAWTENACQYTLYQNGQKLSSTTDLSHFSAAYRPRSPGAYQLTVTVTDPSGFSVSRDAVFTVTEAVEAAGPSAVYSQKDGWWKDKVYRHSNLGKSGCAIFALSHALERMGYSGEDILPENLAIRYAVCLTPGEGTNNERLINSASRFFGFKTRTTLYSDAGQIVSLLRGGALFSFSVARGHIAMISGISEDGTMAHVVDSAPGATFERIVNGALYYQLLGGGFREALSLDAIPGARWYLDTQEYGGLEYWMQISYVAKRGVRLIQPQAE